MKTVDIEYQDDERELVITLKEATGYDGIRFAALQTKASASVAEGEDRMAEWSIKVWTWPACMASTEKISGRGSEVVNGKMSIDDFMNLPWNLIRLWESAAVEVNPSFSPFWRPRKKNETSPDSGSTAS